MKNYRLTLTTMGLNLIAQATSIGSKITIDKIGVGEGTSNSESFTDITQLVKENERFSPEFIQIIDSTLIHIQIIIPPDIGGYTIREIGVYSGETLIAYGNFPETVKPVLNNNTATELLIDLYLTIQNAQNINILAPDNFYATETEAIKGEIRNRAIDPFLLWKSIETNPDRIQTIAQPLPVGSIFPVALCWGAPKPDNSSIFKYVELRAGSLEYNNGLIDSENITIETYWGTNFSSAKAKVCLKESPLYNQEIRLINTEKRYLRSGDDGKIYNDAIRNIYGYFDPAGIGSGDSNLFTHERNNGWEAGAKHNGNKIIFNASRVVPTPKIANGEINENRPRTIEFDYFMRIL